MKVIVTTTINEPTEALRAFAAKADWSLIVVGDKRTPEASYVGLPSTYLSVEFQQKHYNDISELIGWNCTQRRNIGFIEAFKAGATVVASVDDDNIPYQNWGDNLLVDREVEIDTYKAINGVFDPLSVTNHSELWHRGYPLQLLQTRHQLAYLGKTLRKIDVQADLWDGDPDIDAIVRITMRPCIKFDGCQPYSSVSISPFNSQNTFLSRRVFPHYAMLPQIGRAEDIWGAYLLQQNINTVVAYCSASVYQRRNEHDLIIDMQNEMLSYRHAVTFLKDGYDSPCLPSKAREFYKAYRQEFHNV